MISIRARVQATTSPKIAAQEGEIDPRTDGDEEEAQEQALERLHIGLELVFEFRACQDNAGDKGPKRG